MPSSVSGYLAHLVHTCWSFFLSIFSSRHRKRLSASPELPISLSLAAKREHRDAPYDLDGLASWQRDKQQFLRRPSLARARAELGTHTHETREKKPPTTTPPPPEIYIQDWSSLGLNMTDVFNSLSTASGSAVECSRLPVELPTISEESSLQSSEDPVNDGSSSQGLPASPSTELKTVLAVELSDLPDTMQPNAEAIPSLDPYQVAQEASAKQTGVDVESVALSFSTAHYAPNALSAVSGLLWDPPSCSIPHSTPLPNLAPVPSTRSTSLRRARESMVPYPDLFDFSMYSRRISRDSFCDAIELPSFSVSKSPDKKSPVDLRRPVSVYDVNERDRYRSVAYSACIPSACTSSPRRPPFASTLNLRSGGDIAAPMKSVTEDIGVWNGDTTKDSIGAQWMTACDELSRCEWTEVEFLKVFASSTAV